MSYQPPGQQPGGYPQQQDPRMGYQPPMGQQPGGYPQQGPPRGGNPFISPGIQLNPLERMAVMLLRLIAWIALILVIIAACTQAIGILMTMGDKTAGIFNYTPVGENGFRFLMLEGGRLVGGFALQLVGPALLFGVAAIVENLAAIRNKP